VRGHSPEVVRHCPACGGRVKPGPGQRCLSCLHQSETARAERLLAEQHPEYVRVLARMPEAARRAFLRSLAFTHRPGAMVRFPRPSEVFAGIPPAFDDRLIRDGHEKNVGLCQALAVVPKYDQREFYERYCADPIKAQRWVSLPRWKRYLMAGDKDDHLIWKLFIIRRTDMEGRAQPARVPWTLAGQGRALVQEMGVMDSLSPTGVKRLIQVLSTYGSMLAHGEDVGEVTRPPWKAP
jgi:hypothetical protein